MITYAQMLTYQGGPRKNFWLIYGTVGPLIQDAVEIAKDHVYGDADAVDFETLFADNLTVAEFRAALERPFFEERKLVLIHNCEKLTFWEQIPHLTEGLSKSIFLVFVSGEFFTKEDAPVQALSGNKVSRVVRCVPMTDKALRTWITSRLSIDVSAVDNLLGKFRGDYEWLLNKVRILEYLCTEEVSSKMVDLVCQDEGQVPFQQAVLEFDKRAALQYIIDKGPGSLDVNRLATDLHSLAVLQESVQQHGKQSRPLLDETGLTKRELDEYLPLVGLYDAATVTKSFVTLTRLSTKLKEKDRLAYLSLVARW